MTKRHTRRTVLSTIGAAALAGCITEADPAEETASDPGNGSATDATRTDPSRSEAVVEDFEDLGPWTAMRDGNAVSPATDDPAAGTQSARIEAGDAEYAGAYRSFVGGVDLRDKRLSLAVNVTEPRLFDLSVQLLAPDIGNAVTCRRTLTGPTDRWVRVDLGVSGVDRDPDLGNVQEIRVVGRPRTDDGSPVEFRIDDLRAAPRPDSGAVVFAFEGTLESHYETAYPIMREYGFAGVETVIPEAVYEDGRLSVGQMREMRDDGWDMAARPRTGSRFLHEFSADRQRELIQRTKTFLENKGFPDGAKHFFTPKNVLNADALDVVEAVHEQAFRFGGAPNGLPTSDPYNLGHFSGSAGADTKQFVDHAAEYGQLAVLQFDDVGGNGASEAEFRSVLDHVRERDVTVLTATELLDR